MISPQILYIRVTSTCNAQCFMCDCWRSGESVFLDPQSTSFLDELHRCVSLGLKEVVLTGGEPLTLDTINKVVYAVTRAGASCHVITNGLLLRGRLLQDLMDAGLSKITVSIDSPEGDVHDGLRGTPGLFQAVCENVRSAVASFKTAGRPLSVRINTVLSTSSVDTLHLFPSLIETLGVSEWALIPVKNRPESTLAQDKVEEARIALSNAATLVEKNDIRVLIPTSMLSGDEVFNAPNSDCRVLESVAFVDIPGKRLSACNLTIYRAPDVVVPFDWHHSSLVEAWSQSAFVKARDEFRKRSACSCCGCARDICLENY